MNVGHPCYKVYCMQGANAEEDGHVLRGEEHGISGENSGMETKAYSTSRAHG